MTSTTYQVTGMTCEHCVRAVTEEIGNVPGVTAVTVALVAGVILLGWTGSGGEGTDVDVTAHLGGFAVGALLGATAALPACRQVLRRVPQLLPGAAALASVAIAWACALAS